MAGLRAPKEVDYDPEAKRRGSVHCQESPKGEITST